jgi:ABC-2 type transport system permease protein
MSDKIINEMKNQKILINDQYRYLDPQIIATENIVFIDEIDIGKTLLIDKSFDVLVELPENLLDSKKVNIYALNEGIIEISMYEQIVSSILRSTALAQINNPLNLLILTDQIGVNTNIYTDNEFKANTWTQFIIPVASIILYFIFTSFATANLLLSVSEEKENRMIEIVLSSIKPKELILGKILGILSAVFTQIFVLFGLILLIFVLTQNSINLPFALSDIKIDPFQVILSLIYLILGFLFLANIMVACGASMPTYRDASNFSSIFIMLSIFPIYFFPLIITEPNGTIALITSYFPFTAPMILMLRNALDTLPFHEIILSIASLILFIYLSFKLAYKLFEFGAMEYSNKISFKKFFQNLFKR